MVSHVGYQAVKGGREGGRERERGGERGGGEEY